MAGLGVDLAQGWAVAVSGGGDSVALMHLANDYARGRELSPPIVLTVDHGLRPASAKDAKRVAAWARRLKLKSRLLTWRGKKPKTGIEAAAREARYRLMGNVLREAKITTLFVGHNQDDQAETFLLRLARGSGLDGLAGMQGLGNWPVDGFPGLKLARPLLGLGREALRDYLRAKDQPWLEDPMNQDRAFDRIKVRQAQAVLAEAGLSAARIAAAAAHLARARESLEVMTQAVLARAVREQNEAGIVLDASALTAAPREVGLRALACVLMTVSGETYRPRFDSLERLFDRIAARDLRGGATLHGCQMRPLGNKGKEFASFALSVTRESPRKTVSSTKARS